jgi:hypothetical protein
MHIQIATFTPLYVASILLIIGNTYLILGQIIQFLLFLLSSITLVTYLAFLHSKFVCLRFGIMGQAMSKSRFPRVCA